MEWEPRAVPCSCGLAGCCLFCSSFVFLTRVCAPALSRFWRQLGCSVVHVHEGPDQSADSDDGVRVVPQLHRRMSVAHTPTHSAHQRSQHGLLVKAARRRGTRLTPRFLCVALRTALCAHIRSRWRRADSGRHGDGDPVPRHIRIESRRLPGRCHLYRSKNGGSAGPAVLHHESMRVDE